MVKKVPISSRALIARIRRKLMTRGETLNTSRQNSRGFGEVGRYYIVDASRNAVVEHNIDLEELGHRLKVLQPYEAVVH